MATWASKSLIPWSVATWPWTGKSIGSMVGGIATAPTMVGSTLATAATMSGA